VSKGPKEKPVVAEAPEEFVGALQRIFRPLVRFLIARSLPYPFVAGVLRGLYVDVANREFPVPGKAQTDSRITLLTGVHRKDVKRLRLQPPGTVRPSRAASLGSQLIARWTTQAEYLDGRGRPKPLPRLPEKGVRHTFESLVRSINTDIRPRVVLDEWQRLGVVRVDDGDRVCLNMDAFIPPQGSREMTYYFGRNLHDHVAAAAHNLGGGGEPFLERSVNYNNLTEGAVAELAELARKRAMEVLQELNTRALRLQRRDSGQTGASHRINFGVYLFSESETDRDDEG